MKKTNFSPRVIIAAKLSAVTLASTLILPACSLLPKEEAVLAPPLVEPAKVQFELAPVKRGEIVKRVKGVANFTPTNLQNLFFSESSSDSNGFIKTIAVKEGDKVKKGQLLIELDTGSLEYDIEQEKLNLKKAQLAVAQQQSQKTEDIAPQREAVKQKQIQYQSALADYQRTQKLYQSGAATKQQLADAQKEMQLKQSEYNQENYNLQNAVKGNSKDVNAVKMAQVDVQSHQIRLQELEKDWNNARIVSPIDGYVTFLADKKQGDGVKAFESLVQIADPHNLQLIYTATNTNDLADVDVGMPVSVTINGKTQTGKVVQTPRNVPADLPADTADLYKRSILVAVDKLPDNVEMGGFADIEVITQRKANTLIIPRRGLRTYMGRDYVQVLDGNSKKEVDVEKGVVSATDVEILRGLKEGDKVILK